MDITWRNERRKISELKTAYYNPRKWTPEATEQLTASIERFDLADPIIINRNNVVIGGHFRLKILKQRGVKKVDVRVPSRLLTPIEEKELNLRLNKNQGEWNFNLLNEFGKDLLEDIGFENFEIDTQDNTFSKTEVSLRPYKKVHVLLSFPPDQLSAIAPMLEQITQNTEVEYEQSAN